MYQQMGGPDWDMVQFGEQVPLESWGDLGSLSQSWLCVWRRVCLICDQTPLTAGSRVWRNFCANCSVRVHRQRGRVQCCTSSCLEHLEERSGVGLQPHEATHSPMHCFLVTLPKMSKTCGYVHGGLSVNGFDLAQICWPYCGVVSPVARILYVSVGWERYYHYCTKVDAIPIEWFTNGWVLVCNKVGNGSPQPSSDASL